ncbi:hypothetical protein [Magnetofaba australis]|uniref:Uncharacterized protein n=1 Tax=Magnetofaba australis IT-1 TaxID=1434232 RepID=A0A1Y2K4I9_9PROT|nr:hypothetical protein [Magnetofaba australis]OSM04270.1 hypothetical protein MAIT1_04139 [Magnetofaba australis IT-1]
MRISTLSALALAAMMLGASVQSAQAACDSSECYKTDANRYFTRYKADQTTLEQEKKQFEEELQRKTLRLQAMERTIALFRSVAEIYDKCSEKGKVDLLDMNNQIRLMRFKSLRDAQLSQRYISNAEAAFKRAQAECR